MEVITMVNTQKHYIEMMTDYLEAWNRADAEAIAAFFPDNLDYRDPSTGTSIRDKKQMIDYLRLIFSVWPKQQWVPNNLYQHEKDGAFTCEYSFVFANDKIEISGSGMDLIIFQEDKIQTNHVYLNADKWNSWLKKEFTGS